MLWALAATAVGGCADDLAPGGHDCGRGTEIRADGHVYCVYEQAVVIETGFSCPGGMVAGGTGGLTICGEPGAMDPSSLSSALEQYAGILADQGLQVPAGVGEVSAPAMQLPDGLGPGFAPPDAAAEGSAEGPGSVEPGVEVTEPAADAPEPAPAGEAPPDEPGAVEGAAASDEASLRDDDEESGSDEGEPDDGESGSDEGEPDDEESGSDEGESDDPRAGCDDRAPRDDGYGRE
jgi:hypothetical protein